MKNEIRAVRLDRGLYVEAYRFQGAVQPFPNHFHEHYVIGLIEDGQRLLSCKSREYLLCPGSLLLLNPGDSHACTQYGGGALDYRGLHIPSSTLRMLTEQEGFRELPGFAQPVLLEETVARRLRSLHEDMMRGRNGAETGQALADLLSSLLRRCGQPLARCTPECPQEIERTCAFIRRHFQEPVRLEQLCRCAGLSRSSLLRIFARYKGITPYRYLETVRIQEARTLLEQGVPPADAAVRTGFSDQSHLSNRFRRLLGFAPGVYRGIFSENSPLSLQDGTDRRTT